jgi:hypothetical protein
LSSACSLPLPAGLSARCAQAAQDMARDMAQDTAGHGSQHERSRALGS